MSPQSQLPCGATKALESLPPRSWTDVEVPRIPEGVDSPSAFYEGWLIEHLSKVEIPLTKEQEAFLDRCDYNEWASEHAPEGLGHLVAEVEGSMEIVEASHLAGETWSAFVARQKEAFHKEQPHFEPGFDWNFETEWCCDECVWRAIGAEVAERESRGKDLHYPDIPYRAYLSLEIKAGIAPDSVVRDFLGAFGDVCSPKSSQSKQ